MRIVLPLGENTIVLEFADFDDEVNVDDLTSIDYSNLFGEAITISALLNKIGLLKAEAEAALMSLKLAANIYEATLSRRYRREANVTSGKFTVTDGVTESMIKLTEEAITMAKLLDPVNQNNQKAVINAQKNFGFMDSLYWAIQSKDKKISVLMKAVTPEEFYKEIVEGKVNSILIKKPVDTWTKEKK